MIINTKEPQHFMDPMPEFILVNISTKEVVMSIRTEEAADLFERSFNDEFDDTYKAVKIDTTYHVKITTIPHDDDISIS